MNIEEQEEQFEWMERNEYYTIPLAVHNDYNKHPKWHWDWWDQPDMMADMLERIRIRGKDALVVVHPRPGWSMSKHLDRIAMLHDAIGPFPFVQWGWEINDLGGEWGNGTKQLGYLAELHQILGSTPLYVHFTPERWSGWPSFDGTEPTKSEFDWLKRAKEHGVVALNYQDWPDKPIPLMLERALYMDSPHGYSPGIAGRVVDGTGLMFNMFEFSRDEERHVRVVQDLQADARVTGWC